MNLQRVLGILTVEKKRRLREWSSGDIVGPRDYLVDRWRGYCDAVQMVQEMANDERLRKEGTEEPIGKWLAGDMRRACQTALHYMLRGERTKAIQILKDILEKVSRCTKRRKG